MKKVISIILSAVFMLSIFTACTSSNSTDYTSAKSDKISVVATIFPGYDWAREIIGDKSDNFELTMLLDNGVDLHSYQPTATDIMKISTCDLFIYVGGESEEWVEDALKNATNPDMQIINFLDTLGETVKEEEIVEGMESDEDDDDHDHDHKYDEVEYDEHVWLSVKNAQIICDAITDKLSAVDSENAAAYKANSDAYKAKLSDLDGRFQTAADTAKRNTILFADRFPFRYLTDDYGIKYYAAFVGCSTETDASFDTITFLAAKIDELDLTSVLTIEGTTHKIADTIILNTKDKNQTVISMNSMQSVTSADSQNGITYLSVMEDNLAVLTQALN